MGRKHTTAVVLRAISTSLLIKKSTELEKGRNDYQNCRVGKNIHFAMPEGNSRLSRISSGTAHTDRREKVFRLQQKSGTVGSQM
jgi:hypothetical protein